MQQLKAFQLSIVVFLILYSSCFSKNVRYEPPIDIVYTWVDGNDPEWLEQRQFWYQMSSRLPLNWDSNTENRYNDRQELRYSLRSLYKYINFYNHIFIVTCGQRPKWLKNHPDITIIEHKQMFKDTSGLPTFNSHAIEANLHRIPGLSEHFIYVNDDVFFAAPMVRSDFFSPDGKILFRKSNRISPQGQIDKQDSAYISAWKNTNRILDETYGYDKRHALTHQAFSLKKSLIARAEKKFQNVFIHNSNHKFRAATDFTLTNGLVQYYAQYEGLGTNASFRTHKIRFSSDEILPIQQMLLEIQQNKTHMFCIQDSETSICPLTDTLLEGVMKELYPDPAPWELYENR